MFRASSKETTSILENTQIGMTLAFFIRSAGRFAQLDDVKGQYK
ncbi:hypothetical protein RB2083_1746 [Rhodobacteraceae bacterium HTCC2083]|jgi:hypothetical protein|nr:hypothetical protein RB2083_1746 [Rhodobacteraceae bacterium HTCC2083]